VTVGVVNSVGAWAIYRSNISSFGVSPVRIQTAAATAQAGREHDRGFARALSHTGQSCPRHDDSGPGVETKHANFLLALLHETHYSND